MKTEIINLLQTTQAFNGGNQGIDARYVYRLLKVGRDYSKWIKARIEQAGFIENQDYITVQNSVIGLPKLASKNTVHFLRDKMGEQKETRGGHNVRDQFTTGQLNTLKILQSTNTALINLDMTYHERKGRLLELAERERLAQ